MAVTPIREVFGSNYIRDTLAILILFVVLLSSSRQMPRYHQHALPNRLQLTNNWQCCGLNHTRKYPDGLCKKQQYVVCEAGAGRFGRASGYFATWRLVHTSHPAMLFDRQMLPVSELPRPTRPSRRNYGQTERWWCGDGCRHAPNRRQFPSRGENSLTETRGFGLTDRDNRGPTATRACGGRWRLSSRSGRHERLFKGILTHLYTLSHSQGASDTNHTDSTPGAEGHETVISWQQWDAKVHYYRVHKSFRLVAIFSQIHRVHITTSYLRSVLILSTCLHLGLHSDVFPSDFPTNILYAFLNAPFVLHALSIWSSLTWSF
jgi:hypothetical protein